MHLLASKPDFSVLVCDSCELGFLSPMPDDATLAAVYGAGYYASWNLAENHAATRRMKRATFRRLLQLAAPWLPSGAPILDLGCATGFFLEVAAELGFAPFGVDIARYAIDACEAQFGTGRFYCGQVEDATFSAAPNVRFAAIFMSDYIEHVRAPREVLAQAASLLAPRGIIAITTPNLAHLSRRLLGAHWPHFKLEHLWYFSQSTLGRLLVEAGMDIVAIRDAHKSLSLAYLASQFSHYPLPVVTPAVGQLARAVPDRLADKLWRIPTGETIVIAQRK